MTRSLWIGVLAATACSPAATSTKDLEITDVPCMLPKGELFDEDGSGPGIGIDIHGPTACERALELFLKSRPDQRIASVIPIQHAPTAKPGPLVSTRPGTQRLLVLHTGKAGPWPRARELGVDDITCYLDNEHSGGHVCGDSLLEYTNYPRIELWVPITADADTAQVLVLYRGEPHRQP